MKLETTIPLFPLGLVLLPQIPLPLHIFEERYKLMIGECLADSRDFGIVYFNAADIQTVGCTAKILRVLKRYNDGRLDILTRGQNRFLIKEMIDQKAYLEARVVFFDDEGPLDQGACQELADKGINLIKQYASILEPKEFDGVGQDKDFKSISFLIAGCEGFSHREKQKFLEMTSTYDRLKKSIQSLEKIMERIKLTAEIHKIIGGNGNISHLTSTTAD